MSRPLYMIIALALSALVPACAVASDTKQLEMSCQNFPKTASVETLRKTFGAKNVTIAKMIATEGYIRRGVVLFANDPRRRVEVFFDDEKQLKGIDWLMTDDLGKGSDWVATGVGMGMSLTEVERLNAAPFSIQPFGVDEDGTVQDWDGGALEKQAEGCPIGVRFNQGISGCDTQNASSSSDLRLRRCDLTVIRLDISYERKGPGGIY